MEVGGGWGAEGGWEDHMLELETCCYCSCHTLGKLLNLKEALFSPSVMWERVVEWMCVAHSRNSDLLKKRGSHTSRFS